jgi:O-antigen/teichoic acid export membrane protein
MVVVTTATAVLQADLRLGAAATVEAATRLLGLAAVSVLVLLGQTVTAFVVAFLALASVQGAILVGLLPRTDRPSWRPSVVGFGSMVRRSLPVGVAIVLAGAYVRLDALLVPLLAGLGAAADYAVACRALDVVLLVPSLFGAALLPVLTRVDRHDPRLGRIAARALWALVVVMTPVALVVAVAAPGIVRVIGGVDLEGAVPALRLLMAAAWFSSLDILLGLVIVATGLQGRTLWINMSALVLNVALNLALVPVWGAVGAAAATAACEALVLLAALVVLGSRTTLSWPALRRSRAVRAAGLGLGLVPAVWLAVTWVPWPVLAASTALVFVVVGHATRTVTGDDWRALRQMWAEGRPA